MTSENTEPEDFLDLPSTEVPEVPTEREIPTERADEIGAETPGSRKRESRSGAAHGLVPRGAVPSVKCSAIRSNGEPCARWAIVGGTVCPTHGGSAPQVREAARRRIQTLAPDALDTMVSLLDSPSEAVRQRAAADILDRAGLKSADVIVEVSPDQVNELLDGGIERAMRKREMLDEPES